MNAASDVSPMRIRLGEETIDFRTANLDELAQAHDKLIGTILLEEEELIQAHRWEHVAFISMLVCIDAFLGI
jgi:hypothetical protein